MDQIDIEENSISVDEEDKKFVSEAVKFVLGHARNGFVPLCASVATLLKEKANLKLENESLQQQIEELKKSCKVNSSNPNNESITYLDERAEKNNVICNQEQNRVDKHFKIKRKENYKTFKVIKGCLCKYCIEKKFDREIQLTPPLNKGERVVIVGNLCGSIQYFGHVDELDYPEIFVGLYLDEAVGDNDGTLKNKTYFKVPRNYGYFVPLSRVCCLMDS